MTESALGRAIRYAAALDYDHLRDLLDVLHYRVQLLDPDDDRTPNVPRHGRPPATNVLYRDLVTQAENARPERASDLVRAFSAALEVTTDVDGLPDLQALSAMVGALLQALSPEEQRRQGRGYIDMRYIPRLRFDRDTNRFIVVHYGPYAYLRRWATGGGRSRRRHTLKSHYLGKDIALCVINGVMSEAQLIDAFEANRLDQLKEEASETAADLPYPDDAPEARPFVLEDVIRDALDAGTITDDDLSRMFNDVVLDGLEAGLTTQATVLDAYVNDDLRSLKAFLKRRQRKLQDKATNRNHLPDREATPKPNPLSKMRRRVDKLKLLKKAAKASRAKPAYVARDSANHNHVIELAEAGLVETFIHDSPRRVYYQLTETGREVAEMPSTQM